MKTICVLTGAAMLTACQNDASGLALSAPSLPARYAAAAKRPAGRQRDLRDWWQTFGDDVLIDLIAKAFASNKDLNSTRAKVLEARAQLGISKTNFSPKANLASEYENGRNSDFEDDELKSYNKYAFGFDASWEIDLFGRNKHTLKAAKANLESEYASLENAW